MQNAIESVAKRVFNFGALGFVSGEVWTVYKGLSPRRFS